MCQSMKTDRERVNEIFKALREAGYAAEQNYTCCSTCGWAEICDEYGEDVEKVVFYHAQDAEAFEDSTLVNNLYLAWSGNGHEITQIIEAHGMRYEWNGSENRRIAILPQ